MLLIIFQPSKLISAFLGSSRDAKFCVSKILRLYVVSIIIRFINYYYPMNMIGHNDKFTQLNKRKMIRDFCPIFTGNMTDLGNYHISIFYCTEITFPVFCTNGYKIRTILAVIP